MDLWRFQRGDEEVAVTACSTVVADNVHRDLVRDLMVADMGVGRILEWDTQHDARFAAGTLVPALRDWVSPAVPPLTLLHRSSVRRIQRVCLFIDALYTKLGPTRCLTRLGTEGTATAGFALCLGGASTSDSIGLVHPNAEPRRGVDHS